MAVFGYVWKNEPVQKDIYPSIPVYLFRLTPKVYTNLTFYCSKLVFMTWKKRLLINEVY